MSKKRGAEHEQEEPLPYKEPEDSENKPRSIGESEMSM